MLFIKRSTYPLAFLALSAPALLKASPLLQGDWNCATKFSRPEGDYRLQAVTQLLDDGKFVSNGTLYAFNSLIGAEIPLAFNASGQWQKSGSVISGKVTEGDISTGYSFLDRLADLLEDEVRKQPVYSTQIQKLNKETLVLAGTDQQAIECVKATAQKT
ncbi:hypothetical protein [Halioxenophilus aromaticivorans]|uniref:Uncharacterized protein n=1 Tax=Halioxenophilus aromaticivorans TaxID=1306992 RepID=A0AAV3U4J0_9ALTE